MTRVKVKLIPVVKDDVSFNSKSDQVGIYFNDKINEFKKKMFLYLYRVIDVVDDINYFIDDAISDELDKVISYVDDVRYKNEVKKREEEKKNHMGKIMSLMSDGDGISEQITSMKEFKKELLMDNFLDEEINVRKRR